MVVRCGICGQEGHNRRTCPNKQTGQETLDSMLEGVFAQVRNIIQQKDKEIEELQNRVNDLEAMLEETREEYHEVLRLIEKARKEFYVKPEPREIRIGDEYKED